MIHWFRKMELVRTLFVDRVSGLTVSLYKDASGQLWMNTHARGFGRVKYGG